MSHDLLVQMAYYCFLRDSITIAKHHYLYKILGSKGFFVSSERMLEFPGFCVTRHLAGAWESSYASQS